MDEKNPEMTEEMRRALRERLYGAGDPEEIPSEDRLLEEEDLKKQKAERLSKIQDLSQSLVKKRDTAVTARSSCGIEQIWREDELAFEGMDESYLRTRMIDFATQTAQAKDSHKDAKRSRVIMNIVRPKCETAEGRFSDIQLPTDDRNWGLKTTPVPEVVDALHDERPAAMRQTGAPVAGPDGKPLRMKDIAKSDKDRADEKMLKMEKVIDDQLTECGFNGECRKAIRDAVRLGTGVLKGPMVVKDIKKRWAKKEGSNGSSVRVLVVQEDHTPASRRVDPWDVFPDPECLEDTKRAGYMWERRTITPRELRCLVGVDGYLEDQIMEILMEEPTKVTVATDKENQFLIRYNKPGRGSSYEMWEYNGDVDKDDLEALGVDCSDGKYPSLSACVVMVNDKPIKAQLNHLDTGEIPYDFFQWTERTGIPWGIGIPRELMWTQRIIIAAWRAMMDNAGDSAGANIVIGGSLEPIDGTWEITGKKLWRSTDESIPIDRQFGQFQIENNQQDLQRIIELALRFADMETQIPMLFNGERGELPETLGATNIMVDSSNVALRSRVKRWDDSITRPHITRYYDWNMQYNEDDSIKGDYKVDPRGTSVLLERDQESQDIKDLMQLRADPEIRDMVDWKKAIKKLFFARKVDVLLPDDKIEANEETRKSSPPPMDPTLQAAQLRSQAELQKAQITQQSAMTELQFKAVEAEKDRAHEQTLKLIDREIKAMELSSSTGVELEKIKKELTIVATQVAMAKDKSLQGKSPQLTEPPLEPPEKAAPGRAFPD